VGRNSYDAETKAAVMAELLKGQAVSKVAADYDIPEGTVKGWKSKAKDALGADDVPTETAHEIGDLLLEYVRESLHTLRVQAQHFRDLDWLREQGAAEAATLHGVQTDKVVRILEAMSPRDVADD